MYTYAIIIVIAALCVFTVSVWSAVYYRLAKRFNVVNKRSAIARALVDWAVISVWSVGWSIFAYAATLQEGLAAIMFVWSFIVIIFRIAYESV